MCYKFGTHILLSNILVYKYLLIVLTFNLYFIFVLRKILNIEILIKKIPIRNQ